VLTGDPSGISLKLTFPYRCPILRAAVLDSATPAPQMLRLKPGAQVMLVKVGTEEGGESEVGSGLNALVDSTAHLTRLCCRHSTRLLAL
jgi:hypothetical protein